jgi:hypothetical protein
MKNVLLAVALSMAVPSFALAAQGGQGGAPSPAQMVQQAQQELGLTNDQTSILSDATQEEMRAHYEINMRYLSRLSDNDKAAMNQEHMDAAKKRQTRVMGMLTPEQQSKAASAYMRHKSEAEKAKALSPEQ